MIDVYKQRDAIHHHLIHSFPDRAYSPFQPIDEEVHVAPGAHAAKPGRQVVYLQATISQRPSIIYAYFILFEDRILSYHGFSMIDARSMKTQLPRCTQKQLAVFLYFFGYRFLQIVSTGTIAGIGHPVSRHAYVSALTSDPVVCCIGIGTAACCLLNNPDPPFRHRSDSIKAYAK